MDVKGNLFTFSPELVDLRKSDGGDFSIGHVADVEFSKLFSDSSACSRFFEEVQAGVDVCRATCGYFAVCGGGAPVNKLGEHGTFVSGETLYCRLKKKMLVDVLRERMKSGLDLIGGSAARVDIPTRDAGDIQAAA